MTWSELTLEQRRARMVVRERTGIGYIAHLVLDSRNRKTGRIPVSMTDMASCPSACGLRDRGRYAEYGKIQMWWRLVARRGVSWRDFCAQIEALPEGQLWRHNEAGDLPGVGDELDTQALAMLVRANRGRRGFTFTHKPLRSAKVRSAIASANARGFTINLSADGISAVDRLADLGIGPVVTVVPTTAPAGLRTPAGRKVVLCPAETDGLTCAECRLCAHATRKAVVAFRAHGQAKQIVSGLVRLRRNKNAPFTAQGAVA